MKTWTVALAAASIALLAPTSSAFADDDCDADTPTACTSSMGDGETHLSAAWVPAGVGLGVRAYGEKDAWMGVEGRFSTDGRWLARGSLGVDVFGGGPLDLRLGLFAAGIGTRDPGNRGLGVYEPTAAPAFGTDVAFGGTFNRLYGHIRWVSGFEANQDAAWISETEYLVGFRMAGQVRVFGEFLSTRNGPCCRQGGFGAGVDVAF